MNTKTTKIMIVEDDEVLAHTIERRFELEGFEAVTIPIKSSTIKDGISKIISQVKKEKIDLIVLDYIFDSTPAMSTPETSGPAVLQAIRKYDKYIPVIAYSGYPNDIDQNRLVKDNISFIVFKGEENVIVETVNKFLRERDKIVEELEDFVKENPKAEQPILALRSKTYSLKQMLNEIRKGSPEGRELYDMYKAGLAEVFANMKKKEIG